MIQVAARLPNSRMHENRRIEPNHISAVLHRITPPNALHVVLELDAQRPVIPARARAAVNLARLKYKPAPLTQRHNLIHLNHLGILSTGEFRQCNGSSEESQKARTPQSRA